MGLVNNLITAPVISYTYIPAPCVSKYILIPENSIREKKELYEFGVEYPAFRDP